MQNNKTISGIYILVYLNEMKIILKEKDKYIKN